ncbi:SDR family oxidoreductase [Streptomyces sp. NPDC018045]|uniref:SDR family oxidoreductase n=1 Tax=Streptomyces sp. NPDC018045 TaxID=3365037 RepID=UPI0037A35662
MKQTDRPAGPLPEARTVLLTGANGYLGRFLCREWLERVAERGGTLVCVLRGGTDELARARLDAAFDSGYANGYGASEWAGEVLLRAAHDTFGLPVAVFRSNLILAHTRYRGQLNLPDIFTRLMVSLLATGIAPGSFYVRGTGDAGGHYDGLPVDFTAQAIAALGDRAREGYRTCNVVNPHEDGISLDTFVDWPAAAGHPLTRIHDHDEWLGRFETAMRGLPERRRQHSLLPLLHAFAEPEDPLPGSALPAHRFRAAVRAAALTEENDTPHLSQDLITKYVADLRTRHLL